MTRTLIASSVAVLFALTATPAAADGLLYQLPEDGAWVLYDLKVKMTRDDTTRDATGTLRMSSVGTADAEGQTCRWIEFDLKLNTDGVERTIVAKILVPEAHLKEGQKPVENRVRGWVRMSAVGDIVELTDDNLGPIPTFLADPLTDVKMLAAEAVKSKLGELSCAGLTGKTEFVEGSRVNKVMYETRRHGKAPFGVVTSRIAIDVDRDGTVLQKLDMDLTLSDFGKSAASGLPDQK